MNILNGTEAFAALAAGQQIECRHVQAGEFDDIRNFPATVYFNPEFEFRIAIKFFQIGEMQVPEPIREAPVKGTQCFVPSLLTEELSKPFKWKNSYTDLVLLGRGLVHLIQEYAETHALALITVSSGIFENTQKDTSNDVEEKTCADHTDPQQVEAEAIETDPSKIIEKFAAQIDACTSANSVLALRHTFLANGHLEREHQQHLIKLTEVKLLEIDPEQYKPNDVETSAQLKSDFMLQLTSASELVVIDEIANQIESENRLTDNHKSHLVEYIKARQKVVRIEASKVVEQSIQTNAPAQEVFDESAEYQILLNDLINRARESKTPAEANALIKYTSAWTEEQRKPLIDAIHARLVELNPPVNDASLSVRISKAPDLTELDALEIDVSACDEFIQPKLMELVHKRRAELDPFFNPLGNAS